MSEECAGVVVCEPRLVQTVRGHRGEVTCVDACGARLVSGGGDRALRLWAWGGGGWQEAARAPAAHRYGVTAARWAAGGALLASGGVDGAVRVWCGRGLGARRALAAPRAHAVRALCWAGRARLLAGHDDGALCVWHVSRATLLARLRAHEGALHAVASLAHSRLLLTACTDGVLKVFDLAEVCRSGASGAAAPAPLTWVDGAHDLGALCAAAPDCGSAAATGGHDALVRVWRVAGRAVLPRATLRGHGAAVTALRWAPAATLLASASLDRTARLWGLASHEPLCLHVLHAHTRYLTCITLAHDLRYLITGSNDKSVKMWSLGSLTLDDELVPPCAVLEHFALGDLEGIGPLEEVVDEAGTAAGEEEDEEAAGSGARRVWHATRAHAGAINCVATHDEWLATASSDGWVRIYRWCEALDEAGGGGGGSLVEHHSLEAHQYPAMSVDFGAGGALLLSAGLDGRACLWDVQSGVQLRVLSVCEGGEAGGGGVRGARVSPRRPPLLLLATDDGIAPLWSLDNPDPRPVHVFAGHSEAVVCCAWSADGRVAASGAASGELRLLAPPPRALVLHHEPHAHDLGVQSCDFAGPCSELDLPEESYLLATAGSDSYIKLWIVETQQECGCAHSASVRLCHVVAAHGGGACALRWRGALLASAGADAWARVWRLTTAATSTSDSASTSSSATYTLRAVCAAPAASLLSVSLLSRPAPLGPLLATATLTGDLTLWQLPVDELDEDDHDEATPPALWGHAGVARWIREYITRVPGTHVSREEETILIRKAHDANVTGSRLIDGPVDQLLEDLGYGDAETSEEDESSEKGDGRDVIRARLRDELMWLRRDPPPVALEQSAPHSLLCPLSHRLMREPARAADGYSYERANLLDWFIAAEGAVSPVSSRRLRDGRAPPNYALRDTLRKFLIEHEPPA